MVVLTLESRVVLGILGTKAASLSVTCGELGEQENDLNKFLPRMYTRTSMGEERSVHEANKALGNQAVTRGCPSTHPLLPQLWDALRIPKN